MMSGAIWRMYLLQDSLTQRVAKFDTPLVKGIDIPEDALGKRFVFVKG